MTEGPGQVPTPERKERSDDRPTTSEGSDEEDDRGTERVGGVHQEPIRRTQHRGTQVRRRDDVSGRLGPDEGGRLFRLRNRSSEVRAIGPKRLVERGTVTGTMVVPPNEGVTMSEDDHF